MDAFGFVLVSGGFAVTKRELTGAAGAIDLAGANALIVELTDVDAFVGVGGSFSGSTINAGIGFVIEDLDLSLALVDVSPLVRYTGLELSAASASLEGIPGLTFEVTSLLVQVNQVTPPLVNARLDWSSYDAAGELPAFSMDDAVQLHAEGDAGISAFGFVAIVARFSLTKATLPAALDVDGIALGDAEGLRFSLTNASVFVGLDVAIAPGGAAGFAGDTTTGSLGIGAAVASLKVHTILAASGTRYVGIEILDLAGGLSGIDAIDFDVDDVTVKLNRATTAAGLATTPRLNWGAAALAPTGFGLALDASQELYASGSAIVNLFDLVTGSADFELIKQDVDVDLDGDLNGGTGEQLTGAGLLLFGLSDLQLAVGIAGFGIDISGGTVALALLKPAATAPNPGRSWMTLQAAGVGGTLHLPGVIASVENLVIEVNRASAPVGVAVAELDWADALDLDRNGTFGDDAQVVGVTFALAGGFLRVAGDLVDLDVFGLLTGAAGFELVRDTVDADVNGDGARDLDDAILITFSLSLDEAPGDPVRFLRVGVDGFGLLISDGTVRIAALAPALTTDARRWVAVQADGLAASLTLPLVTASVENVSVEVNRASGGATVLNWLTAIDLDETGAFTAAPLVVYSAQIRLTTDRLAVKGDIVGLDIAGFVKGTAKFELTTGTVTIKPTAAEAPVAATLMTLGLTQVNLTIGDATGVHFAINGGSLALATLKPTAAADRRSWMVLKGSLAGASLVGIPNLTLQAENLVLELNRGSNDPDGTGPLPAISIDGLDWRAALNLDRDATFGEAVDDRLVIGGVGIDLAGNVLRASGIARVDIFGLVEGRIAFSFEQQTVDAYVDPNATFSVAGVPLGARGPPADLEDATLTTIGLRILPDDGNATNGSEALTIGAGGVGFTVETGTLALASLKPSAASVAAGDTRSWLALTASIGNGSFTGIDGFDVTIHDLTVEINQGTNAPALDWTKAIDTDRDGAFLDDVQIVVADGLGGTVTHTIEYDRELFGASGDISVDIFGFISGRVGFTFETRKVDVDVDGNGTRDHDDATQTLLTLTVSDVFVGVPNGVGFRVTGGTLALATLKPAAPADTRSWLALTGTLTGGSFVGVTGLELTIVRLAVEINKGSNGALEIPALNWTTALDLDGNGAFGDGLVITDRNAVDHEIDFTGDRLAASGVANVNLFGFVRGTIGFDFETATVDVSDPVAGVTLDNAKLTTLAITIAPTPEPGDPPSQPFFAGVGDVGFQIGGGTLAIAMLKPGTPGDARSWTGIKSSLITNVGLVGIDGFTLMAQKLQVEINQASGTPTVKALNWQTAIRYADAGAYGDDVTVGGVTIDATGQLLRVFVTATIQIDSFVHVSGNFAIEKGDDLFVTAGPGPTIRATALKIGASNVNVFAGFGGPYWQDSDADGDIDGDDTPLPGATGLALQNVSLAVVLLKEAPTVAKPVPTKSWFALKASGGAALVGIDSFQLGGTLTVEVNSATDTATPSLTDPVVDFTKLPGGKLTVATGPSPAPSIDIAYSGRLLRVAGSAFITIDSFVHVSASFAFEKGDDLSVTLE
ncbi:MAG: hypothetical protein ACYC1P_11455, partial [Gaiellaceae bacterium]